jgi:hypothetical protein
MLPNRADRVLSGERDRQATSRRTLTTDRLYQQYPTGLRNHSTTAATDKPELLTTGVRACEILHEYRHAAYQPA